MLKFIFISFNILMTIWVISYWIDIGQMLRTGNEAEQAGAVFGALIGTLLLFFLWSTGDIILGMLRYFTREK